MFINLKKELNDKQYEAAATIDGPVLIIAGAGSGKTRMITYRIAAMMANDKIKPENILALTFTNKAAKEMAERIGTLSGQSIKKLSVSTFHAFGVQVLKKHITKLGYQPRFTIYDQNDQLSAIKEAAREIKLSVEALNFYDIANLFSSIKTKREGWSSPNMAYKPLYETYNKMLHAYNAVDFDDLITLPIKILQDFPEVLQWYQNKFQYIMIDEFQDTSLIQYKILELLGQKYRNVCVVGDDDQSIYSWRGANYQNIVLFEKHFPERKEIMLEQNYRSSGNILSAANNLIQNNTNRKEKKLWTPSGKGMALETFYPQDEFNEAKSIIELIHSIKMKDKVKFKDFGILVRTNSLTTIIEETLLNDNIPYRVSGGSSFFQRKEVKDLIGYLKIMVNPDDEISLLRALNLPRRGIGLQTVIRIRETANARGCSFYAALKYISVTTDGPIRQKARLAITEFVELIEKYTEKFSTDKGLAAHTHDLITEINYWSYLVFEHPENEKLAKFKYSNLTRFMEMMDRWEKNPDNQDADLDRYLTRITLITSDDDDKDDDPQGKVNLMTIHASKGLEFDTVFLAGVEDHILPHEKSVEENPKNIEEERRLFYVAITRAKRKLYMSSCQTRRRQQTCQVSIPSRFIDEIPQELLANLDNTSDEADDDSAASFFNNMSAMFDTEGE